MSKDYGQFCGLANAATTLGERWALLLQRDLSVGPRRFKELHGGLPGIPTSVLTARLRDLQAAGGVTRGADGVPGGGELDARPRHGAALSTSRDVDRAGGCSLM